MSPLCVAQASVESACGDSAGAKATIRVVILKLKRTPGLYLVGFMAAGKTTIGRLLADELGWCFVDIDTDIEAQERRSIADIFREHGEPRFRELESKMIRDRVSLIESGDPCVMALGGGAFVQPGNWQLIQNNGVTVWLDCRLETVRERLGDDTTRPLARDRRALAKLFEDRRPLYARSDFRIDVETSDTGAIVRKILELPIF